MYILAVAIVALIVAAFTYIQMRKGQKSTLTPGDLDSTSADEGNSIPVVFGTCDVSPNVTAFLVGTPQAIRK